MRHFNAYIKYMQKGNYTFGMLFGSNLSVDGKSDLIGITIYFGEILLRFGFCNCDKKEQR